MNGNVLPALQSRELELGPARHSVSERWTYWRMATDADGIAWLVIDKQDASNNSIDEQVLRELDAALSDVESDKPKGLVLRSAKSSGFMVGADVSMFRGMTDFAQAKEAIRKANEIIDRLEALSVTTIAVVHSHCVGGGLELALACNHRIAIVGATLGFPEILLGLHPGLGGTGRSTHLIDPIEAMKMMLTGRSIDARRARSLGLVDAVTQERHVRNAIRAAASGNLSISSPRLKAKLLTTSPARRLAAQRMRANAAERAPPQHYPAPNALISLWEQYGGDRRTMMRAEQDSFAKLLVGDTAQNLIRVFFLRSALKDIGKQEASVNHVHVVGAGEMGGEIAAWCAARGLTVTLADLNPEALGKAMGRANALFEKLLKNSLKVRDAFDRLTPDPKGVGVRHADLIIEAVPEQIELKRKVYADIEPRIKPAAILATNTSSIRLEVLCEGLSKPDRFIGLHFFNPVSRMQLVEVVRHPMADASCIASAKGFIGQIDRLPVEVKSAPGFLVNRALTPYLAEAIAMIDEGVPKESIDKAAEDFGMPMGPIELADQVGLDICVEVARTLRAELNHSLSEGPAWLKEKVEKGELGSKTGKGFYMWKNNKPIKLQRVPTYEMTVTDRLILPMLNACAACLREGIVEDADTLDGAMIFATGFAPFRGGPINYARTRGIEDVVEALRSLERQHGERFTPDEGWDMLKARLRRQGSSEAF